MSPFGPEMVFSMTAATGSVPGLHETSGNGHGSTVRCTSGSVLKGLRMDMPGFEKQCLAEFDRLQWVWDGSTTLIVFVYNSNLLRVDRRKPGISVRPRCHAAGELRFEADGLKCIYDYTPIVTDVQRLTNQRRCGELGLHYIERFRE